MEDSIVWVKWRQVLCYCVGLGCCVLDVRALDLVFELGESECGMPGGHGKWLPGSRSRRGDVCPVGM